MYSNLPNPEPGWFYITDPENLRVIAKTIDDKKAISLAAFLAAKLPPRPLEVITFSVYRWGVEETGRIVPKELKQVSIGWFEDEFLTGRDLQCNIKLH